jgi:hypothetical protein
MLGESLFFSFLLTMDTIDEEVRKLRKVVSIVLLKMRSPVISLRRIYQNTHFKKEYKEGRLTKEDITESVNFLKYNSLIEERKRTGSGSE